MARAVREKLARGDLGVFDAGQADTFEVYATRWLEAGEGGRKASTQRFYTFNLTLHINPILGSHPIVAVTRADCRDLLTACRQKGLKLASLQGVQRTLSAVLSQAVEDALLPANPEFRMGKHLRPGDQPRAEIHPLSHAEAHHLVTAAKAYTPELWVFFLMALRTGMRLGELLAVQWGDLELMDRFVDVRRSLVGGRVTSTKNTNRRRVDLSLRLTGALRDHRTAEKARESQSRPSSTGLGVLQRRRVATRSGTISVSACSMVSSITRSSGRFASMTCGTLSRPC